MTVYVSRIVWDTEGQEIEDLPTEGYFDIEPDEGQDEADLREEIENDAIVADVLSDQYGWCILSLEVFVQDPLP